MSTPLGAPLRVALGALHLDPNNPRLGAAARPGYDTPGPAMEAVEQERLEAAMARAHPDLDELERAIVGMGWTPVDPMLVWEPPTQPGRFFVLEGNSRLCALRRLHRRLGEMEARDGVPRGGRARLEALRAVVAATEQLDVVPVAARDAAELGRTLPRLLGVRHITHARQWRPAALHRYIHGLYVQAFAEDRGGPLALEEPVLRAVGTKVCLASWRVRRAVQAVTMQAAFEARFGASLPDGFRRRDEPGAGPVGATSRTDAPPPPNPAGVAFEEADQAWFLALLEPGHARARFGIADRDLELGTEAADVLFAWAFSRPRGSGRNVWRSPGDVKLWNRIAKFDARHGTRLAAEQDVAAPALARPMAALEAEFFTRKAQKSPLETLRSLLRTLREVNVGTLEGEREELRRLVDELAQVSAEYRRLLDALGPEDEEAKP
ncbi:MAG: hypothetical protein NDJ94_17690 [Vicinamibacteria bacterium]|nr:hypothetical protein [Vicinamibacteria bacterium]